MDYGVSLNMESLDNISKHKVSYSLYMGIKRVFDIFCALFGLIIFLPLSLVVKIAYVLSGDFSTIYYSQKRVGKNGKLFNLYKFRTMVPNADELLIELLKEEKYKKEWEANQKFAKDPRITKIGKFLRKTSLDEIPQFFNMLIGDMSLVGPRPLVPGELDAHAGNHNIYERVRPGITGWWAVNDRDNKGYDKRLKLEYYYVLHQSIKLDIICIFKTFLVIFKGL